MKIIGIVVCGFLLSVNGYAQDDLFLAPLGKSLNEYRDRIICVAAGYEFGESYTAKSSCKSYRVSGNDSFRVGKIVFYTLCFHRDTGKIINNLSFDKTIKDEKKSRRLKRANEEFKMLSEWLDSYCGSPGVVPHNIPRIRDQKYKIIEWKKGAIKFLLQQVDMKKVNSGNGFSTLSLWIEKQV